MRILAGPVTFPRFHRDQLDDRAHQVLTRDVRQELDGVDCRLRFGWNINQDEFRLEIAKIVVCRVIGATRKSCGAMHDARKAGSVASFSKLTLLLWIGGENRHSE